jgi:hypothetical protein
MGTTQKQTRIRGTKKADAKVQLKSRSAGASTAAEETTSQPLIGNQPATPQKEDPVMIVRQIIFFNHTKMCAMARKARLEDLMQRKHSPKKWDAAKKAKMVRKLMTANQELEESVNALDQLNHRLSQITTQEPQANNVAPFVPPPATSISTEA